MLTRTLSAVLLALVLPAAASAATVSPGGKTIQATIDEAAVGETITVEPGVYRETVSSNKSVDIVGLPGAVVWNPDGDAAPTLELSGGSVAVTGLTVISTTGDGVRFSGASGRLSRAVVLAVDPEDGRAVVLLAGTTDTADKTLTVDSTVLAGKTGLTAAYTGAALLPTKLTVRASHATVVGALNADRDLAPTSTIDFTVTDSIVRGSAGPGVTPTGKNSVAGPGETGIFRNPARLDYRLRADAGSVIDQADSTDAAAKDVEGEPRVVGAKSDLGADEFVNRAPTAVIAGSTGAVREGRAVTFEASKSSDPERNIGGGIVSYHWEFGDGTSADTTTPTTTHAYSERKQYSVTVTVTDRQGMASAASAPAAVSVLDGKPPTVTISQPGVKQRLNLYRRNAPRRRARVTFFGNAADDTAVATVYLALRTVASRDGQCRWYNGKARLVSAPCAQPKLLTATLTAGTWTYRLPLRARLPRGPYQLLAVAVDSSGLGGALKAVAFRFR